MMKWEKKGLIWAPNSEHPFGKTRLMCPTPFLRDNETLRIFLGFCDGDGVSRPGYVDVNPEKPHEIINVSDKPLLDIGDDGLFDDNGLCPASIVKEDDILLMYYFAFQLGVKLPYYMFTGMAVSNDQGQTWEKYSNVPVLDRSDCEPFMRSGPCVTNFGKDPYRIYYTCGNKFIEINDKRVHTYEIHLAESSDGRHWPEKGIPVIRLCNDDEFGFGRPYVFKEDDKYKMIYSIRTRSKGYRIGYAESDDGINWKRMDEKIGIDVSDGAEWDSRMICYASYFHFKKRTYLFYNGNGLGNTGFGYAELAH